jgi:hypothetical protein
VIQPDPALSEQSASIEKSLARAAREITTDEFSTLIGDPGNSVLRAAMQVVAADSLTVWLADVREENLVVTHTFPDPSFAGWKQPLSEGLVGLTYASEQRLCENQVYQNRDHSKRVDEALSQVTFAMIATPFHIAGNLRGVISCVQLKDSVDAPDPAGFSARDMNRIGRLATALERLVNYRLLTNLLGVEL